MEQPPPPASLRTPAPAPVPAPVPRLARLDGLRGVAACVVVGYHLQIFFYNGLSDFYGGVAGWFFRWGWTFVDLFFVISGYIFAHVYRGGAGLRSGGQLGDFAVARIARLYPLHLAMLLIVAVLDWGKPANTIPTFLCHLFMLQGLVPDADAGFVGPSWSISVEVLCYFLFALAACSGKRTLLWMSVALVGLTATRLAIAGLPGGPWGADRVIGGLLGFFLGQLLWQYRDMLARVPTILLAVTFAIGAMADTGPYSSLLPLDLLAWPSALLLALRVKTLEAPPLRWLGDRSYGIYLIHYPVLNIIYAWVGKSQPSTASVMALYVPFFIVVLALSDLALRAVERPGRRSVRAAWDKHRGARGTIEPSRLPELD